MSDQHANAAAEALPLVSLAIPIYNHARYAKQSIESAIAQDYANIELIIIDDGSSDDTVHVVEGLKQRCIERFVRFEFRSRQNLGVSATLDEALAWAEGKYFAALDSDDVLKPDKISRLMPIMENEPRLAGVFSGNEAIDGNGSVFGVESSPARYFGFEELIMHRHTFSTPGQLLRTKPMKAVGGYVAGMYIQDWYMWLKLTEAGHTLKNVPDVLVQYRYHDSNISKNRQKMFESRQQILSHFKNHSLYSLAMAISCVWAAIDFSCMSKSRSFGFLCQSVQCSPRILATRYFAKGVLRWLSPCFLIKHAESLKARWPKLFAYLPDRF